MGLLLDRFGIDAVIVEKSPTTTDHPKSRGCWVRTMEIFRQWGIEQRIRDRGRVQDNSDMFVQVESIAGREIGRSRPEPNLGQTPAWKCLVAQDAVEEEIYRVIEHSNRVQVRFSTEFIGFEETEDGVECEIRSVETGKTERWHAKYLLACDGAGSRTRHKAGIDMVGPASLAVLLNEYWRADLSRFPLAREAAGYQVYSKTPGVPRAGILNTNGRDRWLSIIQIGHEKDERPRPWTDSETIEMIRAHVGVPDLEVTLLNSSIWRMSKQVAASFLQAARLPGRRCRPPLPADGRLRPEFGRPGRAQPHPGKAGLACCAAGRRTGCSTATTSSAGRWRSPMPISASATAHASCASSRRSAPATRIISASGSTTWTTTCTASARRWASPTRRAQVVIPDGTSKGGQLPRYYTPSDRPGGRFHISGSIPRASTRRSTGSTRTSTVVAGPLGDAWLRCRPRGVGKDRHAARAAAAAQRSSRRRHRDGIARRRAGAA